MMMMNNIIIIYIMYDRDNIDNLGNSNNNNKSLSPLNRMIKRKASVKADNVSPPPIVLYE